MKKQTKLKKSDELIESELLALESEVEESTESEEVTDVTEACDVCDEDPCICDEEEIEEADDSEEDEEELEGELDSEEDEGDDDDDIECECEPEDDDEEELELDGDIDLEGEEDEEEYEESELTKARAEEGDIEESAGANEFYNYDTDTKEVHGSADTLDAAKEEGGDIVEVDPSDEVNGHYKIVKIHLANGKTMDPDEVGLEDRFHPTKGLAIGGSHLESVDYSGVHKLVEEEEGLTESFKAKAALIFEAEVRNQASVIKERLEEEYQQKLTEETEKYVDVLSEQVDSYLTYAVEHWMKENEVAIEKGLRTDIAESFMSNLKSLFEESYIEVPEAKVDLYSELEKESAQLQEDIAKAKAEAAQLTEQVNTLTREKILESATSDLAKTQAEKLVKLTEGIKYENTESFTEQVDTLKKFYFSGKAPKSEDKPKTITESRRRKPVVVSKETIVEGAELEEKKLPKTMEHYLSAISRLNKASGK